MCSKTPKVSFVLFVQDDIASLPLTIGSNVDIVRIGFMKAALLTLVKVHISVTFAMNR